MQEAEINVTERTQSDQRAQVVFLKPVMLVSVQVQGPYAETISKAWEELHTYIDTGDLGAQPNRGYGIFYHDPRIVKDEELRYAAGVPMPTNWRPTKQPGIFAMQFEGGTFLRTTFVGPYENLNLAITKLRENWIPQHGLVLDQKKPVVTIYRSDKRTVAPEKQVGEVCLPVFADRRRKPRD